MADLNAIAHELGDLGREEAALTHKLLTVHKRRCELLNDLGGHLEDAGQIDTGTMQAAAQKKPPPNPVGGG